jgi:uncharacterized protein YdcH (DUF465 family)
MLDLLVYLLDDQYKEEIFDTFKSRNFFCHIATAQTDIIEICQRELVDLILIWPANYQSVLDVLKKLKNKDLHFIPVIPVVQRTSGHTSLMNLDIADIIQIPTSKKEFFTIIDSLMEKLREESIVLQGKYWQGNLAEMNLPDLIHRVEMSRKDALMTVTDKGHFGQIYFRSGQVVRATYRSIEGLAALKKLSALENSRFQIHFTTVSSEFEIGIENQDLIEVLGRYLTEFNRLVKQVPDVQEEIQTVLSNTGKENFNELQKQILELCKNGESIYNLLLVMNQDNIEILRNVFNFLSAGKLISAKQYMDLDTEKKGIGQMIDSFGSLFKIGKKRDDGQQVMLEDQSVVESGNSDLDGQNYDLDDESYQKIAEFFK